MSAPRGPPIRIESQATYHAFRDPELERLAPEGKDRLIGILVVLAGLALLFLLALILFR